MAQQAFSAFAPRLWSIESAASLSAARTALGLGTVSTQAASNIDVTGGKARLSGLVVNGSDIPYGGSGLEMSGGASANIQGYDRVNGAYIGIALDGLTVSIRSSGSARLVANENGVQITGSAKLASYTVAGLPSASTHGAGAMVYVTNESGGAVPAFSDGSAWRRVTDRAVVS